MLSFSVSGHQTSLLPQPQSTGEARPGESGKWDTDMTITKDYRVIYAGAGVTHVYECCVRGAADEAEARRFFLSGEGLFAKTFGQLREVMGQMAGLSGSLPYLSFSPRADRILHVSPWDSFVYFDPYQYGY